MIELVVEEEGVSVVMLWDKTLIILIARPSLPSTLSFRPTEQTTDKNISCFACRARAEQQNNERGSKVIGKEGGWVSETAYRKIGMTDQLSTATESVTHEECCRHCPDWIQ